MGWTHWLPFSKHYILWDTLRCHISSHQYLRLSIKKFKNKFCIAYYRKTRTVIKCYLLMPRVAFNALRVSVWIKNYLNHLLKFLLIYLLAFHQHHVVAAMCLLCATYPGRCQDTSVRTSGLSESAVIPSVSLGILTFTDLGTIHLCHRG